MPTLQTGRLGLRPWKPEDADFVYAMYSRWDVMRFIGQEPRVMENRSCAERMIEKCRTVDHSFQGFWAVQRHEDLQLVGTVMLMPIPASGEPPLEPSGDTEIAWHFHPDYWGCGYATEGAQAVLAYGFEHGAGRIVAVTAPANTASQKVCQRIGMTHRGTTDRYYNAHYELFEAVQQ
jgi:RimJ/RimL family protein N-acetyltransferase